MLETIEKIDCAVLLWIRNNALSSSLIFVMRLLSFVSENGIIWIAASAAMMFKKKYRKNAALVLAALLLSHIFANIIIKPAVSRPRPFIKYPQFTALTAPPAEFSFPSGHSTSSFAAAYFIGRADKKLGTAAYTAAVLIALSRIYLFVHFPSDIIAGAVLGTLISALLGQSADFGSYLLKPIKDTADIEK